MIIAFTLFTSASHASAYYVVRAATDTPSTFRAPVLVKEGAAPYYKDLGSGTNRWGDFSNSNVDPVNDTNFWIIGEYAAQPTSESEWGTWIAQISWQDSPAPSVTTSAIPTPSPSAALGLSAGVIAAIVIACVVFVAFVLWRLKVHYSRSSLVPTKH